MSFGLAHIRIYLIPMNPNLKCYTYSPLRLSEAPVVSSRVVPSNRSQGTGFFIFLFFDTVFLCFPVWLAFVKQRQTQEQRKNLHDIKFMFWLCVRLLHPLFGRSVFKIFREAKPCGRIALFSARLARCLSWRTFRNNSMHQFKLFC